MAGINGTIDWGIQPLDYIGSNLSLMSYDYRQNYLKSANEPMRYQVEWTKSDLTEAIEPSKDNYSGGDGDVVNIIFDVYATTKGISTPHSEWDLIVSIKKSRDIANKHNSHGGQPSKHRFTVDISQICQNLLSYSLVPIQKGTWQSTELGGLNGGSIIQDNVTSAISAYNITSNESFKFIQVVARAEIIKDDGTIIEAANTVSSEKITIINSVHQFEGDDPYLLPHIVNKYSNMHTRFLTNSPNSATSYPYNTNKKSVRIDDEAEWLYFYMREAWQDQIRGVGLDDVVGSIGLRFDTYNSSNVLEDTFYIIQFTGKLDEVTSGGFTYFEEYQHKMLVQNVSPYYVKNIAYKKQRNNALWATHTGSSIIDSTSHYRVSLVKVGQWSPYDEVRVSEYKWYQVDRESEHPYGYVRFHWLNRLGGIDSYTAKRDVVEGISISRDTIERGSSDRTWRQSDKKGDGSAQGTNQYKNDTMRGGDIYKGGREVTSVNAERSHSVYTEPLNTPNAKWLEELITSPNVWIEMDNDATKVNSVRNSYLRPSTKGYIPIIITNSDIELVNQEQGLTRFNIEYTFAHKVQTQRN